MCEILRYFLDKISFYIPIKEQNCKNSSIYNNLIRAFIWHSQALICESSPYWEVVMCTAEKLFILRLHIPQGENDWRCRNKPISWKEGTTFEVVILSARTGAPPHCLDKRFSHFNSVEEKHISDLQHSGNMFIVFVAVEKHAQLKNKWIFQCCGPIKTIKCEMFWP